MKSFAKINIFLKITGLRGNYHELASRFVLLEDIYDEIEFIKTNDKFANLQICTNKEIKGKNIIQKAYDKLCEFGFENELKEFFSSHFINLKKQIPMGGGLGGGSSNAATFLQMLNKELNLKISKENLMQIGAKIGADVPFFLSGFKSANVAGIGEKITEFDDEVPNFKLSLKNISCDTAKVYDEFRANFLKFDIKFANLLLNLKSSEILSQFKNYELNDLLRPCQNLYPNLQICDDEFLSGSGSTCFKVKNERVS